jgi:serine/threonine-protein kinase
VTRYAFDDFCLDVAARALSRSGAPVALTPRVFDTLLHLLERGGELVDKDEPMQAVWPARVVEENNLNQAISALRRALGETRGEHRYILTVPGRGYRFVAEVHVASSADPASATKPLRTLAVLPFRLLQPAPDEALQTGMADTLITRLSGLGELVVRPLSAVCRFSGPQHDPLEIGRRLGVDAVLDGTIQQAAAQMRVSLRLLNVAEGRQQWAEIFDMQADDLFALQDAVAEKAVAALALRLTYDQRIRADPARHRKSRGVALLRLGAVLRRATFAVGVEAGGRLFQAGVGARSGLCTRPCRAVRRLHDPGRDGRAAAK